MNGSASDRPSDKRKLAQATATVVALVAAIVLAAAGVGAFRSSAPADASLWWVLFSDKATTGFVRLAMSVAALYVILSLVALAIGGRWLTALNTRGFSTEDLWASTEALAQARAAASAAEQERDEAIRVTEEILQWLNRP